MKSVKSFKINKKVLVFFMAVIVFIFAISLLINGIINYKTTNYSPYNLTVVLDAGHGGEDGGAVGITTGITECELNLAYTTKIKKYLQAFGINVVETRTTLNGLYDRFDKDFKQQDMQRRKEIIESANASLVISLHMNKFADRNQNGAQVFFGDNNEHSEDLANSIRDELIKNFDNARELTLLGDYYITNCSNVPTVIVECGFLSNEKDEKNLIDTEYQNKMSYSIFCGIARYVLTNFG